MKRKVGILCMVLGIGLMLGALYFSGINQQEESVAQKATLEVMPQLVQQIQAATANDAAAQDEMEDYFSELEIPPELLTEDQKAMTEVEIDGYLYIGYLSVPTLNLELPIMSTWSYPQLKIAPCRFTGSIKGQDLVLMAHNYTTHFGTISQLNLGDPVTFTDMDGNVTTYEVVGTDILDPTAVDEMTAGVFDLTLFTCTYGGKSRITIYCNRISEQ